jgi:hypothetical protein
MAVSSHWTPEHKALINERRRKKRASLTKMKRRLIDNQSELNNDTEGLLT